MTALMHLAFISPNPSYYDAGTGRWFVVPSGPGRLLTCLARRVEHLTVALPPDNRRGAWHSFAIDLPNVEVRALPAMTSIARGIFQHAQVRKALLEIEHQVDAVITQIPFTAPTAPMALTKPRVFHVCGNVRTIVNNATRYGGLRAPAAAVAAWLIDKAQARMINRPGARTVTNGQELWDHYRPSRGRAVISSALFNEEIGSYRRSRPADAPPRLLFVGFLRPEKGLDVLLRAYEELLRSCPTLELEIVGDTDLGEAGAAIALRAEVARLAGTATVRLRGAIPFGPELFQCYADADITVVPSRSEGTPKVAVEARAFGSALVASNVGGIPSSVRDGVDGVLVPPGDSAALAAAIRTLLNEPAQRHALIAEGFRSVRHFTVDALADALLEEATMALEGSR